MATRTIQTQRGRGRFITLANGQKIFVPRGSRITTAKLIFPQGKGVRLSYRFNKDLRGNSNLIRIKQNQVRAERKANVRVGNGLFDDPLSNKPKLTGVVKVQRRRQQNPKSGKTPHHPRKGGGSGGSKKSGGTILQKFEQKRRFGRS